MKTVIGIVAVLGLGAGLLVLGTGSGSRPAPEPANLAEQNGRQEEVLSALRDLTRDSVVLGDPSAPVTLVEFGDYQCTFCTRFFNETKPTLEEKYIETGKLKMYFIDFAINGRESVNAAEASQCAADQNAYWNYHDKLYEERVGYNVGVFKDENLISFAGELGLDTEEFAKCYESDKYASKVQKTTREAPLYGARGTPTFILNGFLIPGAQPLSVFENAIDQMLVLEDNIRIETTEDVLTPAQ